MRDRHVRRTFLLALVLLAMLAATARAQTRIPPAPSVLSYQDTIYVRTTGNDSTGTGTSGNPFRTIQRAMLRTAGPTLIIVGAGSYTGPFAFPIGRSIGLISEAGPDHTILLGDHYCPIISTPYGDSAAVEVSGFTMKDNVLDTVGNCMGHAGAVYVGYSSGNKPFYLTNNKIVNNRATSGSWGAVGGVYVDWGVNARIMDNVFSGNKGTTEAGAIEYASPTGIIAGNCFINNEGPYAGAISIGYGSAVQIVNNTIAYNRSLVASVSGSGIYIQTLGITGVQAARALGVGAVPQIDNNIIAYNRPAFGIYSDGPLADAPDYDIFFENSLGPADSAVTLGSHTFLINPRLDVDSIHLTCPSPARDAGLLAAVPAELTRDIDGQPRVAFGYVDIGADEFYDMRKQAVFYPVDTSICNELAVTFVNRSTCIDENWRWTFGDGDTLYGYDIVNKNPVHAYAGPGVYTVRLIAWGQWDADTTSHVLTIGARPVTAFSAVPDSGYEPLSVMFTDTSKNAPTGWSWTFGDGGTATARNLTHTYGPGIFQVGLISRNTCGPDTALPKTIKVGGFSAAILDSTGISGDSILYSVRTDSLFVSYDHTVYLSGSIGPTPRRGTAQFVFSRPTGVPPFAAIMRVVPSRDLAGGSYTITFAAADSARLTQNLTPVTKTATRSWYHKASPLIRIDPDTVQFDSVQVADTLAKNVVVRNSALPSQGYRLIVQSPVTSGPPFGIAGGRMDTLAAGETLTWSVRFVPLSRGLYTGSIRIRSDDPASPDTSITLIGRGVGNQTPPKVVNTSPLPLTELTIDGKIHLEFTKPLIVQALDTVFFVTSAHRHAQVPGHTTFLPRTLDFVPTSWFAPDDTITVLMRAVVTDTDGNRLDGNGNGVEEGSPIDDYRMVFSTGPGVYPGDADRSGRVDEGDILPLGRYWGLTGQPRDSAYRSFSIQPARSWTPRAATYADADGNGRVDSMDICPIAEFFDRDTGMSKLQVESWMSAVEAWPATIVEALLSALDFCANQGAGTAALRHVLEQARHVVEPIPTEFFLAQNYPNPFNAGTVVEYTLKSSTDVRLEIFDVQGRRVVLLAAGMQEAGRHRTAWDGRDEQGRQSASGVYFVRLLTPEYRSTRKMILLK